MGGSSSGEVEYPKYMEYIYKHMLVDGGNLDGYFTTKGWDELPTNMFELMSVGFTDAGNPWNGEETFDPNEALTSVAGSPFKKVDDAYDSISSAIAVISGKGYFGDFDDIDFLDDLSTSLTGLMTAIDTILDSSTLEDVVDSFEENKKGRFLADVSAWTAGMADINAVHTSSFVIGMALKQKEFQESIDAFERELKVNLYSSILKDGIGAYLKAQLFRLGSKDELFRQGPQMYSALSAMKLEVEKLKIITMAEKSERQLRIDTNEALWDYELFMYAGNLFASISGAAAGRKNVDNPAQTALSGLLSGAAIGSEFGPIGTFGGAGIGFLLGGMLG
jgi:hypothetical protein